MNTRVEIELAKLLKENGWTKNTYSNCWVKTLDGEIIHNKDRKNNPEHDRCEIYLMQPTIADVVMWFYEKYGIWVYACQGPARLGFMPRIQRLKVLAEPDIELPRRNDISKAYELAFEYILTNKIHEQQNKSNN
jgi:hypothetical protein